MIDPRILALVAIVQPALVRRDRAGIATTGKDLVALLRAIDPDISDDDMNAVADIGEVLSAFASGEDIVSRR